MTLTSGTSRKGKEIPEEKTALRQRIAQSKARAKRWAERRKEINAHVILSTTNCTITAVDVSTHEP